MVSACPKCGRDTNHDAVICVGCDYILDTSFLGDDITVGTDAPPPVGEASPDTLGSGALILGKVDADLEAEAAEFESFESEQTGDFLSAATSAGVRALQVSTVYIDAQTRSLLEPAAVLRVKADVDPSSLALSPFESHVLQLIDGERPVARLGVLSGLSDEDLRICLTLIADKDVLERIGTAQQVMSAGDGFDEKTIATSIDTPAFDAPDESAAGGVPDFLAGDTDVGGALPNALENLDLNLAQPVEVDASPFAEPAAPTLGQADDLRPVTLAPEFLSPIATQEPVAINPQVSSGVPPLPGAGAVPVNPLAAAGIPLLPGQKTAAPAPSAPVAPPPSVTRSAAVGSPPANVSVRKRGPMVIEPAPPSAPEAPPSEAAAASPPPATAKKSPSSKKNPSFKKAKNLYDTALKDVQAGRMARALGLARMAHELVPEEETFADLVENWGRARQIADASDGTPEHVRLFHEAKRHEKAKDFDKAIAALEKAAQANPDAAGIQNQLGVLLATKRKDFSRALNYLFRAVELDGNNPGYKNNLGKVLAMSGGTGPVAPLDGSPMKRGAKSEKGGKGMLGRFLKR